MIVWILILIEKGLLSGYWDVRNLDGVYEVMKIFVYCDNCDEYTLVGDNIGSVNKCKFCGNLIMWKKKI